MDFIVVVRNCKLLDLKSGNEYYQGPTICWKRLLGKFYKTQVVLIWVDPIPRNGELYPLFATS